ncbi:MAG: hypothetical protein J0I06_09320 [Planctomycetes bacterium]|nr:hypothetical protein [Planctomycetota bacterium]
MSFVEEYANWIAYHHVIDPKTGTTNCLRLERVQRPECAGRGRPPVLLGGDADARLAVF